MQAVHAVKYTVVFKVVLIFLNLRKIWVFELFFYLMHFVVVS